MMPLRYLSQDKYGAKLEVTYVLTLNPTGQTLPPCGKSYALPTSFLTRKRSRPIRHLPI
jgi:hypothetical protein